MAASSVRMIDVSGKRITTRRATARGFIALSAKVLRNIRDGKMPKGDVLATARVGGIMAAKRTPDIVPLCHPIPLDQAEVELNVKDDGIEIIATAATRARTGVEMEAMTAVSAAALTVYDMCKSMDPGAAIGEIQLLEKSGGKSGHVRLRRRAR